MQSNLVGIGSILVGILATVIPMAFVLRRVFGGMATQQAETQRLLQTGMPAFARVMGVRMGGMTVTTGAHRHLQLVMQLEVHPPGRPPYAAQLTALVSELQIPQLQPGATVQVRIDPANPAKLALEAVGTPVGPPQAGPPSMHYGPGRASPWGPTPGVTPVRPIPVPTIVKVWIVLGLVGGLVSVGVVIAGAVGGTELSDQPDPSTVCRQAVACCQVVTSGTPGAENCKNFGKIGVPDEACRSSLDSFRQSAKTQGLRCE